jgi:large repetitive protein
VLAGVVAATAAALAFDDAKPCVDTQPTFVCPEGVVGASYSIQLEGRGGCGPALPYQYRVLNGALPPGLSLSSSGRISGTPAQSGTYSFWIELSDENPASQAWCNPPQQTERPFTLNVLSGLRITTNSLPQPATVGTAYSSPIEAMLVTSLSPLTGTQATGATWSVVAGSGTLPPGLTLGNGVISGTPTTEGSYQFTVQAELDPTRKHSQTLTIVVRSPVAIAATGSFNDETRLVRTEVGFPISATLTASGGAGTYTWSLASGSPPPGVTTSNGTIIGKPTTAGIYRFSLSAADVEGRTATFAATVLVAPRLAISSLLLRPAKAGKLYRAKLTKTGGVAPIKWSARSPLPRGIRLDRTLGVLSGAPTKPGRYRVTFEVMDALKVTSTKTLVINVLP